jgi:cytochrome c553
LIKLISPLLNFLAVCLVCLPMACAAGESPSWAYPVNPPDFKPSPDNGLLRSVPDSSERLSTSQVRDRFFAPDWHPADHPPMPSIVAVGHKPDVSACGYCHRAEGTGGPENARIAGLPVAYILQQMANYKSGIRSTAVPKRAPQTLMIAGAKAISDNEVRTAAAYFSALKPRQNIRVVESKSAPKTFVAGWFLAALASGEQEPIGQRIIEIPDQLEQFESRDSRATFTAYVPPQSIQKGESLVFGRDTAKVFACTGCHGKDLRGLDAIPSIAGRSPTYVFRQLHEFQTGVRGGPRAQLMKDIVSKLNQSDMIAIAAYLASLKP